jgi:hypothetical protein
MEASTLLYVTPDIWRKELLNGAIGRVSGRIIHNSGKADYFI